MTAYNREESAVGEFGETNDNPPPDPEDNPEPETEDNPEEPEQPEPETPVVPEPETPSGYTAPKSPSEPSK